MSEHAHVYAICRHCVNPSEMFVGKTLDDCRKHLADIPAMFEKDSSPEQNLKNASIQRMDADVYRLKFHIHDLLAFTSPCKEDYQECLASFERMKAMKILAHRVEEMMRQSGMLPPTEEQPDEEKTSDPVDTQKLNNILSQIDLPQDFFGGGTN